MYKKTLKYSILSFYDNFVVALFCFFHFNRNLSVRHRTIEAFGDTEDDTVWQIFRGFENEPSDKIKAGLFQQILEEIYHAEEFYQTLKKMGGVRTPHLSFERKALYESHEPTWKLLLYCHLGEAEAELRFSNIKKYCIPGLESDAITKVLLDEMGHVSIASHYLGLGEKKIPSDEIKAELNKIFWRRRYEQIVFNLKRIFGGVLSLVLSAIYYLTGPFVYRVCRERLKRTLGPVNSENPFTEIDL